jgi:hypothetical protein
MKLTRKEKWAFATSILLFVGFFAFWICLDFWKNLTNPDGP